LRAAFEKHVEETKGQVDRLTQVFKMLKQPAKGKTCPAILGLVEEGEEVMEDFEDSSALDAGLLSGAQALEEEKKTDAALSRLAGGVINQKAA
jgi:ferritin-like metal-binding protein YciE